MVDWLMKQLHDIFTEPDGKTVCVVRVAGVATMAQAMTLVAWDVMVQHAHFDFQAYGLGMSATLGALGLALGMKKDTPQ